MDISPVPAHAVRETPASQPVPPTAPQLPQRDVPLLLPRPAQWTAGALLAALLLWIGLQSIVRWVETFEPTSSARLQLDLNQASLEQIIQLPGVGPAMAQRLVEHREKHGPFKGLNDLRRVPGIGPATLDRLRPHVFISETTQLAANTTNVRTSFYPPEPSKSKEALTWKGPPLDVNQASAADLEKLPGIGPKLAARIIDFRKGKTFASVDDLRKVSGIGPKILEKVRPFVGVGSVTQATAIE